MSFKWKYKFGWVGVMIKIRIDRCNWNIIGIEDIYGECKCYLKNRIFIVK